MSMSHMHVKIASASMSVTSLLGWGDTLSADCHRREIRELIDNLHTFHDAPLTPHLPDSNAARLASVT